MRLALAPFAAGLVMQHGSDVISAATGFPTFEQIYWRGHQQDWQGQWLAARTKAELAWYLPLIAPLIDFSALTHAPNWYARLFNPEQYLEAGDDIDALCTAHSPLARELLATAWSNPQFIASYAHWAADILEGQREYHLQVAVRQHALLHRVHAINTWLFGLTALAALTHLLVHSKILTLMTTFFQALVASLHGALAQSEAYRLEATSQRLAAELGRMIAPIRQGLQARDSLATADVLRTAIQSAVAVDPDYDLDNQRDRLTAARITSCPIVSHDSCCGNQRDRGEDRSAR